MNYEDFLKKYESLSHMELVVPDTLKPNSFFYLPYHMVFVDRLVNLQSYVLGLIE